MTRYRIVAEMRDGSRVDFGPYQNVYVADGAAKMLLSLNPEVVRVYFHCVQ